MLIGSFILTRNSLICIREHDTSKNLSYKGNRLYENVLLLLQMFHSGIHKLWNLTIYLKRPFSQNEFFFRDRNVHFSSTLIPIF